MVFSSLIGSSDVVSGFKPKYMHKHNVHKMQMFFSPGKFGISAQHPGWISFNVIPNPIRDFLSLDRFPDRVDGFMLIFKEEDASLTFYLEVDGGFVPFKIDAFCVNGQCGDGSVRALSLNP